MQALARWRSALLIWGIIGFVLAAFGTPMRFHIGVLVPLLGLLWILWTAVILTVSIIAGAKGRGWIVAPTIALGFCAIFFGWSRLDQFGDRIVFEAQRSRYETAIEKLESGQAPEIACAQFRNGCAVSRANGLRVAFYHSEFFDKYLGYVYDPSGVYASIGGLQRDDAFYQRYGGELAPGIVTFCRPVSPPFYRCFFS